MNKEAYNKQFTGFCKAVKGTDPKGEPIYCLASITEKVKQYSIAKYGHEICYLHQKLEIAK